MDTKRKSFETLDLCGGRLCLDFVNTVDWRDSQETFDYLQTFQDLVLWGEHVDILTDHNAQHLFDKAAERPREAEQIFEHAIVLRETFYRIFSASIRQREPSDKDFVHFNMQLSTTMAHACLVKTENGFSWNLRGDPTEFNWIIHHLIRSAADLLVSADLVRLKQCANPRCDWFFVDNSRNRSRNWCNMKVCGNRAKAHRFYQRKLQNKMSQRM
jgi:predicted RNA-binding Zn ribbon-like protein